jgi:hypothetical protein
MNRPREYQSATDLPPELQSVGSLNAYEVGPDHIRVAFRLSDENYEVGQLALLTVSMTTLEVSVDYVADSFFMGYHSLPGQHDILVEIGGAVRRRGPGGWDIATLPSSFLRDAFTLNGQTDFVFGDDGEIFRAQPGGLWTRDTTDIASSIQAMHGLSPETLHAAGGNGLLMQARGAAAWEQIDIGLGTDLRCVLVERDRVIVAGDRGVAGILKDDEFRIIETGLESDILSVTSFLGHVYFTDSDWGLHRLADEAFLPVANLGYAYRLNASPRWLTIAAGQNFFQYDGKDWRGVTVFYRDGYGAEALDMSVLDE